MDSVRKEVRGAVALVTISRPEALNALDSATLVGLRDTCAELAGDAALRALVLTGEGRAFAAGADIAEMREMAPLDAERFSRLGHEACAALEALAIPTIAAVGGVALGGGCELALACDWIYASSRARFGQPEVKLGVFEPDALLDEALACAEAIGARGPVAVAAAKRVLQEGHGADVRVAHALEQAAFASVFASEDRTEGLSAFLEKRDPKFEGR